MSDLLRQPKGRIAYDYDFGDSWEHEVLLEEVVAVSAASRYPIVLSGQGACPPDDVGGISSYYHFLEAINDPKHPDHEEMVEWGGADFDPTRFDVQSVNRAIQGR